MSVQTRRAERPAEPPYRSPDCPLDRALLPPPNETPEQRDARLAQELADKQRSDAIDERLREEAAAAKKRKEVKILLLGQSQSGKSTTLKQFQLLWAPNIVQEQRISWRPIIFLNLVASIRIILDSLSVRSIQEEETRPGTGSSTVSVEETYSRYAELKLKLGPVLQLENTLLEILGTPSEFKDPRSSSPTLPGASSRKGDILVWPEWQKHLATRRGTIRGPPVGNDIRLSDPGNAATIISACRPELQRLWNDPFVHSVIAKRKLRLEETSGFFLNDIDRIARYDYVPTDEDILRARVRTMGITEHRFTPPTTEREATDWVIYDVGGIKSQRHTWAPYFQEAQAIIFLAPISAFDQNLAEDRKVNRLADSFQEFENICKNELLKNASIILFLNKADLLEAKLQAGVRFSKYVTRYGDRPNDDKSVAAYLKGKFIESYKHHRSKVAPRDTRELYVHVTSVTDIRTTRQVFQNVKDTIVRDYLRSTRMI